MLTPPQTRQLGTPVAAPRGVSAGIDPYGHPPALRPAGEIRRFVILRDGERCREVNYVVAICNWIGA